MFLPKIRPVGPTITARELAKEAEVSVNTIFNWAKAGLFRDIATQKTGNGRTGVHRSWESTPVRARVSEIKRLQRAGLNLAQIAATLPPQLPEK